LLVVVLAHTSEPLAVALAVALAGTFHLLSVNHLVVEHLQKKNY
jgi:hypothetical protein